MNTVAKRSQTKSNAGAPALWFITIFILFWDVIVLRFLIPANNAPFLFKAIFVLVGLLFTVGTVLVWRDRILGGNVSLRLSIDPVPHGVQVPVQFELSKAIKAKTWSVEAKFESLHTGPHNNHYSIIWSQVFPAHLISPHVVSSNFVFPIDYSPKNSKGDKRTHYNRVISLKADKFTWSFLLETRDATSGEMLFDAKDVATIGSNLPTYAPADIEKSKKYIARFKIVSVVAFILIVAAQFTSFFDFDITGRAKAKLGLGAYSSQVTTDEFDVRVTNYAMNNWAFRGRLVGKGRVNNGEFRVRVESLDVQATNECKGDAKKCEVAFVRMLLSQDGSGNFSTQAQSEPIEVNAQLQDITRWSLPADRVGTELLLKLPPNVDVDTMRLKLEIRTAANTSVYPDGGAYLALHRALAKANRLSDPCEKITSKLTLVQAGCHQQLLALHGKPLGLIATVTAQAERAWLVTRQFAAKIGLGSTPEDNTESIDYLLLEALRQESAGAVDALLTMGASPNAADNYQIARTPLGYAAASNDTALVERLLQAGAKPDARKLNERNQIVTPITQALRTDAVKTVTQLIAAGASVHTDDPTGWTPMHIAAYESAKLSLEVLIKAGADVNERTPAYRQQNVLQTALQFGDIETVSTLLRLGADTQFKDNQGENACGWAKFFKRNEKIQALVCNT